MFSMLSGPGGDSGSISNSNTRLMDGATHREIGVLEVLDVTQRRGVAGSSADGAA
jgi:hypothetical protein